jgi:uncharacterized protein (UPF0335 family)
MEPQNHKVIKNFVNEEELKELLNWIETLEAEKADPNQYLININQDLKGNSIIFDISKTEITKYVTQFHSISKVLNDPLPDSVIDLMKKIMNKLNIIGNHIFLQIADTRVGSKIAPHYDASIPGYINYKCNLSVLSDDYAIHVGSDVLEIQQGDLYTFEASLYKHWTEAFSSRRVFMSFGFILPYEDLKRTKDDPRCRMSERIQRYYQKLESWPN